MSEHERERLARVALSQLCESGDPRMTGLVDDLGAVAVHDHLAAEREMDGMLTDLAARLGGMRPELELERADKRGIRFVIPGDPEWPAQLAGLAGAAPLQGRGGVPVGLWVRGQVPLSTMDSALAIVGSRSSTTYGDGASGRIAHDAATAGWAIVSGAAYGIDAAAHRGALAAGGTTIAVLACGVDRPYPVEHAPLLDHIADHGAVVSEAMLGAAPMRFRFLTRNRLIAALSRGTVVVEAAARSGALNTANWTARLHRPVLAVPGPITAAPSEGVHELIRSGAATLVTSGADVLEMLAPSGEHLAEPVRGRATERDRLTLREQQVLDAVPVTTTAQATSVARAAGIGIDEVRHSLEVLSERGFVDEHPGGWRLGAAGLV